MKKLQIILFLILIIFSFNSGIVLAEDPVPTPSADEVNDIAKNMYCPVCENIPLDVCGTEACEMWREEIADLLMLGFSEDEIYEFFNERHGDMVLAVPPARGFNWLIYIVPPVVIAGGIVFLIKYLRSTTEKGSGQLTEGSKGSTDDPYMDKLEEELKKRN